jgi:hypothetical protein
MYRVYVLEMPSIQCVYGVRVFPSFYTALGRVCEDRGANIEGQTGSRTGISFMFETFACMPGKYTCNYK